MKTGSTVEGRKRQLRQGLQEARNYLKSRAFDQAKDVFSRIHQNYPHSGVALLGLAEVAAQKDDFKTAENYCKQAMEFPDALVQALLLLARIARKQDNSKQSMVYLAQVVDIDPSQFKARIQAAKLYLKQEQTTSAEKELRNALMYNPQSVQATVLLAGIMARTQRVDEAVSLLQTFLENNPDKKRAQLLLARIYIEHNDIVKARTLLAEMVGNPQFSEAVHLLLGEIFWRSGMPNLAFEEYRAALLKGSKLLKLHPELVMIHEVENDLETSLALFRKKMEDLGISPLSWSTEQAVGE